MSSIMRARSALTGRAEGWEVIGGSSLELKVAGPSMLGIGCPGRHALPLTPPQKAPRVTRAPIPRERVRSWEGNGRTAFVVGNLIFLQNGMLSLTTFEPRSDEAQYFAACEAGR